MNPFHGQFLHSSNVGDRWRAELQGSFCSLRLICDFVNPFGLLVPKLRTKWSHRTGWTKRTVYIFHTLGPVVPPIRHDEQLMPADCSHHMAPTWRMPRPRSEPGRPSSSCWCASRISSRATVCQFTVLLTTSTWSEMCAHIRYIADAHIWLDSMSLDWWSKNPSAWRNATVMQEERLKRNGLTLIIGHLVWVFDCNTTKQKPSI